MLLKDSKGDALAGYLRAQTSKPLFLDKQLAIKNLYWKIINNSPG